MSASVAVPTRLSVIIPTYNEEQQLPFALEALRQQRPHRFEVEIVLVDGGSQDSTLQVARKAGIRRILEASGGRGAQLQVGAEAATGSVYLFLHADCRLPNGALAAMEHTLGVEPWLGATVAGAFHVRHEPSTAAGPITRRLVRLADLRSHTAPLPYGDQALFVTADAFRRAGGIPAQPLMEDLEFARRLRKVGNIAIVPLEVRTSARRFETQPFRTVLFWRSFPWLYRCGISPQRLMRWYGNVRLTQE